MIDFRTLVKAGVHFGHQTSRWNPKMAPYIWGIKNDAHLIDVSKSAYCLDKAASFLKDVAKNGQAILWVGTKKAAQEAIHSAATQLDQPYVNHRWIGGILSNYSQVKKSITKMLHLEDVIEKSDQYAYYTKKEFNLFKKQAGRLSRNVGGLRTMTWPIGAIVLVDVVREQSALKEAAVMGVPVIAMVDTNADPSLVDYVIPANDDAPRSIKLVIDYLKDAVEQGKKQAKSKKAEAEEAAAQQEEALTLSDDDSDDEADDKKASGKEKRKEEKSKIIKRSRAEVAEKKEVSSKKSGIASKVTSKKA